MDRNFRLSVALDVDDLLMSCTDYAIELANQKYHFDPPITIYEASGWGKLGTRVDIIHEFFSQAEFYETMPVLEGAKEFVSKLSEMAEIFICVLAVWGLYCIFRAFVAWCLPKKNISIAVHTTKEESEYELYSSLKEAQLISDTKSGVSREPVILVDEAVSDEELEKISDTGCTTYLNYDTYRKRQK